tara:strand:+ start:156 stop:548 length:393 start_codon:yes stop_codon:yes gene_type:complete
MKTAGLRHLALWVKNFDEMIQFYSTLLEMEVEWAPDADNVYLTSGNDNLALHRLPAEKTLPSFGALDHLGFILDTPEAVDECYASFQQANVSIDTEPKTHRDGARSFYCRDPDNNRVQMIYHPPISGKSL